MENNLWCFWEEVGLSTFARSAPVRLFVKLVFGVGERRNIIDSFWDSNHGKQSMVFLGRSRSLHLRKVCAC
jgi:hypothetical protein